MSRFNKASLGTQTTNFENGKAYSETPKLELISLLSTSFGDDKFYRSAPQTYDRLKELLVLNDPLYSAKALIYARQELGMRTITHAGAAMLARHIVGEPWAKSFFKAVTKRVDDMAEIVAYTRAEGGKMSKAMQKGFAAAFDKFDGYQLAKYRGEGKEIKLVDLVNLVHPKGTSGNAEALRALMNGTLASADTWEVNLSKAGPDADLKSQAWDTLVTNRTIGYLALLRNLRNIVQQSPGTITAALEMLVDEKLIRKSLVLPFQFLTAYNEIEKLPLGSTGRKILEAIDKAATISLGNMPAFEGESLVVLDVSMSMTSSNTKHAHTPAQIGSLFASAIAKACNADMMVFAGNAAYVSYVPGTPVIALAKAIPFNGGATYFHTIFREANRKYDRIFLLSDMQGYEPKNNFGSASFKQVVTDYKKKFDCNPRIFSFDLAGYGQLMMPEQNIYCLAGFSDKTIPLLAQLDRDKEALVKAVEAVSF